MGEKQNKPKTGSKPKSSKKKKKESCCSQWRFNYTEKKKKCTFIPVTVEECISSEKKYILDRVQGRQPKLYIYIIYILYPVCQVRSVKGSGAI